MLHKMGDRLAGSESSHNIFVAVVDDNSYVSPMNAGELKRLLVKQGCTFENHKGGSGHLTVFYGERKISAPHARRKERTRYRPCEQDQEGPRFGVVT